MLATSFILLLILVYFLTSGAAPPRPVRKRDASACIRRHQAIALAPVPCPPREVASICGGPWLAGLSDRDMQLLGLQVSRLGTTETLSRSKGQAFAARYWISHCLDCDDVLDAGADGFYDVWGSFEGVGGQESGRLPDLPSLLALTGGNVPDTRDRHSNNGGRQSAQRGESEGGAGLVSAQRGEWEGGAGPVREVLLVDRQTDEFLTSLDDLAKAECGGPENAWDRAYLLAKLVAGRMGGAVAGDGAIQGEWEAERRVLSGGSGGCPVLHVGHCTKVRPAIILVSMGECFT